MRPEFIFAVTSLFLGNVHVKLYFNTQILMMKNEQEQEYTTHNQCPPPASRFLDLPSPLWRKACWHKITPSSLSRISICMFRLSIDFSLLSTSFMTSLFVGSTCKQTSKFPVIIHMKKKHFNEISQVSRVSPIDLYFIFEKSSCKN